MTTELDNNQIHIRPFHPSDAETILSWCKDKHTFRLWSADKYRSFPAQPQEMMKLYDNSKMHPLTAVIGNAIIGHFILRFPSEDKRCARLGFVIIDDKNRGKGYGRQMLRQAIQYAHQKYRVHTISLGVFCENVSAIKCYKSVGFRITGNDSYLIDGEEWDGVEMEFAIDKD